VKPREKKKGKEGGVEREGKLNLFSSDAARNIKQVIEGIP